MGTSAVCSSHLPLFLCFLRRLRLCRFWFFFSLLPRWMAHVISYCHWSWAHGARLFSKMSICLLIYHLFAPPSGQGGFLAADTSSPPSAAAHVKTQNVIGNVSRVRTRLRPVQVGREWSCKTVAPLNRTATVAVCMETGSWPWRGKLGGSWAAKRVLRGL